MRQSNIELISKLNEYTCFDVKLPTVLPEGYKFDRAEFYKEDDEIKVENSKYVELYLYPFLV